MPNKNLTVKWQQYDGQHCRHHYILSAIICFLGLQPLLALLDSEYAIIQQLALDSLIQITLDGNYFVNLIYMHHIFSNNMFLFKIMYPSLVNIKVNAKILCFGHGDCLGSAVEDIVKSMTLNLLLLESCTSTAIEYVFAFQIL